MSGSGKSTLLKLLMKFYDYEEGGIFINNKEKRGKGLWVKKHMQKEI